jgi:hypothetical protein
VVAQTQFTFIAKRDIASGRFDWPAAPDQDEFEGNRFYQDLRAISWEQVDEAIALESALLDQYDAALNEDAAKQMIEASLSQASNIDPLLAPLCDLDIGVASAVMALSAADCIPFTSCNGAALGGVHVSPYPIVAFFMKPQHAQILLACAERADTGLEPYGHGRFKVYADEVRKLVRFATEVRAQASSFTNTMV